MNGFYIQIQNGLLRDGHRQRMGSAVWEYMWCLDKLTKVDDEGSGHVLAGRPIKLSEIKEDLQTGEDRISENLSELERNGYITKTRTPYGIVIRVCKAKKRFGGITKSNLGNTKSLLENTKSNKTRQIDNTNTLTREGESKPYGSTTYLTKLPLEDLTNFNLTYNATKNQIQDEAEQVVLYCESKGKRYSNYRSALQSWLLRKYGKRSNNGYIKRYEN